MLLNSTEAMRNATYVVDELAAIPDAVYEGMRDRCLALTPRNTWLRARDPGTHDAADVLVELMLPEARQSFAASGRAGRHDTRVVRQAVLRRAGLEADV